MLGVPAVLIGGLVVLIARNNRAQLRAWREQERARESGQRAPDDPKPPSTTDPGDGPRP